jgi:5-formyltetrahydrofolate cyclo-ligase
MDKITLREHHCQLRESLSPLEVAQASEAVCRHLSAWSHLRAAFTVSTYLAFRNEVDLSPLFGALPDIRWVIPRIEGRGRLTLYPYIPERLKPHRYGMLEPDPTLPVVDPAELDVILVPGVAFDVRGGRLGFGGGFYDRLLPATSALRVGVTYNTCLLDAVPCDEHDQRMEWVATPAGLLEISATR